MNIFLSWCRLSEPEVEAEYRAHYLPADVCQLMMGVFTWLVPYLAFSYIDFLWLSGSPVLSGLIQLRMVFGFVSTLLLLIMRKKIQHPAVFDGVVLGWSILVISINTLVNLLRPEHSLSSYLFDLLLVFSYYILLPNPVWVRAVPAVLLSISDLALIWLLPRVGLALPDRQALLVAFLLANLIGLIYSNRLLNGRLTEFVARRQTELSRRELERLASTDSLTGVFNRRRLMELASEEFYRFRRYGRSFSLALIDMDGFKRVNDTFGHTLGDTVLVEFAQMINYTKREADSIGRMGGDEFCLVLPETLPQPAACMAERILRRCEGMEIAGQALDIHISASIGVTQVLPEDTGIDAVLARADVALYRAKNEGRNRVVVY